MKHFPIELPKCLMHAYLPDVMDAVRTPRPSIVICPGGGYRFRSDREADPIALVFAAKGFNCFIVEYAVAPEVQEPVYPAALFDVAHAVAWVREHAAECCADPNAIAVISEDGYPLGYVPAHMTAEVRGLITLPYDTEVFIEKHYDAEGRVYYSGQLLI